MYEGKCSAYPARLKELRLAAHFTQAAMGFHLGITRRMYESYESGRSSPSIGFFVSVCEKFGVTLDWLLGRVDKPSETYCMDEFFRRVCDFYGYLPAEYYDLFKQQATTQ